VPVGEFVAPTPGRRAAASAQGKTAPVDGTPAQMAEGAAAASARSKAAPGAGSAALMPDGGQGWWLHLLTLWQRMLRSSGCRIMLRAHLLTRLLGD